MRQAGNDDVVVSNAATVIRVRIRRVLLKVQRLVVLFVEHCDRGRSFLGKSSYPADRVQFAALQCLRSRHLTKTGKVYSEEGT